MIIPNGANDLDFKLVFDGVAKTTIEYGDVANATSLNFQNGDLLILTLVNRDALNPNVLSLGAGWNLYKSNFNLNGSFRTHTAVAWKIWNTGDPTIWTATVSSNASDAQAVVFRIPASEGFYAANPLVSSSVVFNDNSGTVSPFSPDLPVQFENSLAVYTVATMNGGVLTAENTGQPSGTNLIYSKRSRNLSAGCNLGLAWESRTSAGLTGTKTWTNYLTGTQYYSGLSFEIRPDIDTTPTKVKLLTEFTDVSGTAIFPTTPAAAYRGAYVLVGMHHSSSTVQSPSTVTIGGQTAIRIAGQANGVSYNRCCESLWWINDDQISAMSGSAIVTSGEVGTSKGLLAFTLYGASQIPPVNFVAIHEESTASPTNLLITREADSFTIFAGVRPVNGTMALTNPNRLLDFGFASNAARFSVGYESDVAESSNATYAAIADRKAALVVNVPLFEAQTINSVNGGNPVKIGSTVSFTKTGFTKAITKGTLDGVALTSATDTTFTVPNLVDGAQLPRIGLSRTLFLSSADDTETATIDVEVANPDGWASTVIETGFNTGELDSIDYEFSPPLAVDDIIFYDSTKGAAFPDAGYEGVYEGTQILWHHDESTKTVYSFQLITGSDSVGSKNYYIGFGIGIGF
jgi:hypothetical protein